MKSQSQYSFLFLFLLKSFDDILILCLISPSDIVEPEDPYISCILVSLYDCSKQQNVCQFSLTRVRHCAQGPSYLEALVCARSVHKYRHQITRDRPRT